MGFFDGPWSPAKQWFMSVIAAIIPVVLTAFLTGMFETSPTTESANPESSTTVEKVKTWQWVLTGHTFFSEYREGKCNERVTQTFVCDENSKHKDHVLWVLPKEAPSSSHAWKWGSKNPIGGGMSLTPDKAKLTIGGQIGDCPKPIFKTVPVDIYQCQYQ